MLPALTGAGLSAAAGLNAFIPLLVVGLFSRFTEFIILPEQLMWLESWPMIIASAALLALELVVDKIPGVDHVNDLIQTVIRPIVGGVIFAATAASTALDSSTFWQDNPLIAGLAGALLTLAVHVGKAASRPAVNATTGGTGAPLASFVEDAISLTLCMVAIFVPILVIVVFIILGIAVYRIVTTGRRRRRHRELRQAQQRLERESEEAEGGMVAWWRSRWREPRKPARGGADAVTPREDMQTTDQTKLHNSSTEAGSSPTGGASPADGHTRP